MPASDTVDGLAAMVIEPGPGLGMVREPDGSIRWERHQHTDGTVFHMPRPVATAADYDRIFGRRVLSDQGRLSLPCIATSHPEIVASARNLGQQEAAAQLVTMYLAAARFATRRSLLGLF